MTFEGDTIQPHQITIHKTILTTPNESGLGKKKDFKICVVPVVCLWMKE